MKRMWLTPEEIDAKKERNKKMLYISVPFFAATFGAGITFLMNMM
ncbi:MAG: hypothetical protein ACQEWW_19080 [Bacillota bacterium]|jgi:hypothetical protein